MDVTRVDLAGLAQTVLAAARLPDADRRGPGVLARAAADVPARSNPAIKIHTAAALHLRAEEFGAGCFRRFAPLPHPGEMPAWFHRESHVAQTEPLRMLAIPDGHLLHLAHTPVVLNADADAVVHDFSGRYAPLVNHVDVDVGQILDQAQTVAGRVFVLGDEVAPLNYAHWVLDALPRLRALERLRPQQDVRVAVGPLTAAFQRETLNRCGFGDARIIELKAMHALRADELLATSDLPDPPHPAFKAAPWALRFLRRHLGAGACGDAPARRDGRRLYVSRGDGAGRRVVNEPALLQALRPLGFEAVQLAGRSVAEQAALFADARLIVGPHGAGLTNALFAPPGAGMLELFPCSYGLAALYVLAMGAQLRYAYLTVKDVVSGSRVQLDDMHVDVDQVATMCREMLQ